jgi:WD40 repeat protein
MTDLYERESAFDRACNLLMMGGLKPSLWDLTTGRRLRKLPLTGMRNEADWAIALTPDGSRAIASYSDCCVRVWDTATGAKLLRWQLPELTVATGMDVTQDRVLIGNRWQKLLLLFDLETGAELFRAKTRSSGTETVAISEDGWLGLSAGGNKRIHIWDLSAGRQIAELAGHTGRVQCVAFGPGGTTAVSGGSDKTVRVWDLQAGKELMSFGGHSRIVDCVAFAPDGSSVASGARDRTVRVWNLADGRERCYQGHPRTTITTVAYRPDGRTLLSVDCEEVWEWDLTAPPG